MPAVFNKFTNDIVSLAVLTLMVVAFVAAQAGATPTPAQSATSDSSGVSQEVIVVDRDSQLRSKGG
ncbi:MAG: hypothetical protein KJO82_08380 [Gammaproteobacteria bacterium]|nr:hypothetical protein [Gammaproteobacteria bacterium]